MQSTGFNELVRQAQAGDRVAIERLLETVRPYLEQIARGQTLPQSGVESLSDVVQEAAMRVWRGLPQFRGGGDDVQTAAMFRDWVSQIVSRTSYDMWRERNAQRRKPPMPVVPLHHAAATDSGGEASAMQPAGSIASPSAIACTGERAQLVRAAVARIADETARHIVELRFVEGLSLRQISDRLGLSYDKTREKYDASLQILESELEGLI